MEQLRVIQWLRTNLGSGATITDMSRLWCQEGYPAKTDPVHQKIPRYVGALVAVWQSAGLAIGRLPVRISAGAILRTKVYSALSTQPSIPPGSVNEYQL